jgi:hypothetical protein
VEKPKKERRSAARWRDYALHGLRQNGIVTWEAIRRLADEMRDENKKLAAIKAQPETKKTKKRAGQHGIDALRDAADGALKERYDSIAKALADHSEKGNIQSAKLLCDLAERKKLESTEKIKKKRSLATNWGLEPEWTRNLTGEDTEIGFGGLEPE